MLARSGSFRLNQFARQYKRSKHNLAIDTAQPLAAINELLNSELFDHLDLITAADKRRRISGYQPPPAVFHGDEQRFRLRSCVRNPMTRF
jgi:hypothetical protein